jgi:hypothetical protein
MKLLGLSISFRRSAYASMVILFAALLAFGMAALDRPLFTAILGALAGVILYWSGETIHQLGHAWAAAGVGYPMTGIRYWGLLSTSIYPADEPPLPGSTHIRRALGGPLFSLIYSLIAAVAVAIVQPASMLWWLAVWLTVCNVFIFTLGALLPLNWTDGGTILKWWGRHDEKG